MKHLPYLHLALANLRAYKLAAFKLVAVSAISAMVWDLDYFGSWPIWSYASCASNLLILFLLIWFLSERALGARYSQLVTLRALGFSRAVLLSSLAGEFLFNCLVGVLIGLGCRLAFAGISVWSGHAQLWLNVNLFTFVQLFTGVGAMSLLASGLAGHRKILDQIFHPLVATDAAAKLPPKPNNAAKL